MRGATKLRALLVTGLLAGCGAVADVGSDVLWTAELEVGDFRRSRVGPRGRIGP